MAKPPEKTIAQYLFFHLNDSDFAIRAERIKEIVKSVQITMVPRANKAVRGVTNIRGELIPVVDINIRFGKDETTLKRNSTLVIITLFNEKKSRNVDIAMLVDIVDEVEDVASENIEPAPNFGLSVPDKFVENMLRNNGEHVPVLNIDAILDLDELTQLEEEAA